MKIFILSLITCFAATSCNNHPQPNPPQKREADCRCKPDCSHKDDHCGRCTHKCGCRKGC